ncbi:MAG: hypothetical protein IT364_15040 [Candidatus Hydrogenedentes bacterium]|nr:hypothetical protein [Candidatus Hydrogenedentota bacterium]
MTCKSGADAFTTLSQAWSHAVSTWGTDAFSSFLGSGDVKLVYKWMPGPFGWAMIAGFSALIVVSLITRPESSERVAAFFERMRHSSDDDALNPDGTRALAADRGEDLLLLDLPGWFTRERWARFGSRYREDLIGFALGWLTVAGLIFTAWALMQIGA